MDQYISNEKVLKIFKIFMIYNNVNRRNQTLGIIMLNFEGFKNSQIFLVISVVIQLYKDESPRVKDNQINFIVFVYNRKNYSKSVARNICFHNKLNIRDPVSKNKYGDKCFLEEVENIIAEIIKLPRNVLSDETGQKNNNV